MLTTHNDIGTAVALPHNDTQFRNRRLTVGVSELCAVVDNSIMLLLFSRQESRNVDQGDDRDTKRIAGSYKSSTFRDINVRTPARTIGLFAMTPTGKPPSRAKPTTTLRAKPDRTSRKLSLSKIEPITSATS